MARIQIADLAQVQTEFDELSDLELEAIIGGKSQIVNYVKSQLPASLVTAIVTALGPNPVATLTQIAGLGIKYIFTP